MRSVVALLVAAVLTGCTTSTSTPPASNAPTSEKTTASKPEGPATGGPIRSKEEWTRELVAEISKEWLRPKDVKAGLTCTIRVTLRRDGTVGSSILEKPCGGTEYLNMMLVAAVFRASPLTVPQDDALFSPTVVLEFRPK